MPLYVEVSIIRNHHHEYSIPDTLDMRDAVICRELCASVFICVSVCANLERRMFFDSPLFLVFFPFSLISFSSILVNNSQKWKAEQQKIEAMSAASAQTFNFMSKQAAAAGYRYAIDDRYRWAAVPANEANFYAVSCCEYLPEMMVTISID